MLMIATKKMEENSEGEKENESDQNEIYEKNKNYIN